MWGLRCVHGVVFGSLEFRPSHENAFICSAFHSACYACTHKHLSFSFILSNAGKSTLLDLLTCRKAPSSVPHTHTHPPALQANGGAEDVHEVHSKPATGKEDSNRGVLLLNGKPAKTTEMRRVSTYIPQVCRFVL